VAGALGYAIRSEIALRQASAELQKLRALTRFLPRMPLKLNPDITAAQLTETTRKIVSLQSHLAGLLSHEAPVATKGQELGQ